MKNTFSAYFGVFGASALLLMGCSKHDVVIPPENDPVFEVHGTLGNEAFDLVAGDNDAFMFTSTKMQNGVRVFTGELSDGETSVELGIFDGNVDMPNSIPEVDLATAVLKFAQRYTEPLTVLTMQSITPNQNANKVDWYINGNFAGSGDVPIFEPGKYDICAFVTFSSGQTEELCDEIIVGYARNANCSINYTVGQGSVTASLNTTGEPIQSVEWLLNGTVVSNGTTLQSQIDYNATHILTARVTFSNGVVREKSCFIDGANPSQTISDFSVFELSSAQTPELQDYKVRMFVEKNDRTYNSLYGDNDGSSITLLDLQEYESNANGNKVYKATLQIEAVLMEMATEKLIPVSFTTTLGIEVP